MKFKDIEDWGYVDAGTKLTDSKGNRYVVQQQNGNGFLCLKNISGGDNQTFESLGLISGDILLI